MSYRTVTMDDGVRLAVRESGPADAPIIVCVHGYPDDGTVWDGVEQLLNADHRVVVYDVRGAGRSDRPHSRDAYLLDRLATDLAAIIEEVSPAAPVHLLAHDWGSLQAWHALTRKMITVRSYTSISGPSLHQAGRWMRSHLRTRAGLRQAFSSTYIGFFRLPLLPEAATRIGALGGLIRRDTSRLGKPASREDIRWGLELYRANMGTKKPARSGPRPDRTVGVPVMVLAPSATAT
ncbi:pimeloyl-ACP methyl ester carboxylesterase [Allocatelliglobosispora scoriae]|uniref:Pimeloyl-ACP methyl ester carboxylesterase n=1 Tax=Allocatelliglobosispora scoriae TaxID=643052 RepID=A0A841BSC4_9ACTN|nr:alpha/beta fold hydrolase [Allocatelliglobosispora scoriae]MBB5869711.1 pimeloyl-ACP methyl ester carboxylesterase [Allocatelliglobosispora scoriae]